MIFVNPRKIPLVLPDNADISFVERPLRASTPKGERVALARSEALPVGTTLEFDICYFKYKGIEKIIEEWLAYGAMRGLGQWRNSGMGKYSYEILEKTGSDDDEKDSKKKDTQAA